MTKEPSEVAQLNPSLSSMMGVLVHCLNTDH